MHRSRSETTTRRAILGFVEPAERAFDRSRSPVLEGWRRWLSGILSRHTVQPAIAQLPSFCGTVGRVGTGCVTTAVRATGAGARAEVCAACRAPASVRAVPAGQTASPWESRWLRWPGWWFPADPGDARQALGDVWRWAESERAEVACSGGQGRTGTAQASTKTPSSSGPPPAPIGHAAFLHPAGLSGWRVLVACVLPGPLRSTGPCPTDVTAALLHTRLSFGLASGGDNRARRSPSARCVGRYWDLKECGKIGSA